MKPFEIRFSKEAKKDYEKLPPKLKEKLRDILRNVIRLDPKLGKRLVGDLDGFYSIRLTYQDRIALSIRSTRKCES